MPHSKAGTRHLLNRPKPRVLAFAYSAIRQNQEPFQTIRRTSLSGSPSGATPPQSAWGKTELHMGVLCCSVAGFFLVYSVERAGKTFGQAKFSLWRRDALYTSGMSARSIARKPPPKKQQISASGTREFPTGRQPFGSSKLGKQPLDFRYFSQRFGQLRGGGTPMRIGMKPQSHGFQTNLPVFSC